VSEDGDPLTPAEREFVNSALDNLVETDRAFVCGICGGYVATRFETAHAEWHDPVRDVAES
jgi:hypothetical protein